MLNVQKLQAIRDKTLGVTVNPQHYGHLNSTIYLQQIRDAILHVSPARTNGHLAEHVYLRQILNAKKGVADTSYGSQPNTIVLQRIINAYKGVADGKFGSHGENSLLDSWYSSI